MKEIIAYEMSFRGTLNYKNEINCVPFQEKYWNEYMKISNTFLYVQNGEIMGAVSCYGNEIDDLVVRSLLQGQGLGQKLLLWGMSHMKKQRYEEIILHVAEWNQKAVKLYLRNGFSIRKRERVR